MSVKTVINGKKQVLLFYNGTVHPFFVQAHHFFYKDSGE